MYTYRAANAKGTIENGVLAVGSREEAVSILSRRGLFPLEVRQRTRSRKILYRPARDLGVGLRALSSLLNAGVPAARALELLDDLAPASWLDELPALRQSVHEGNSLAAAFQGSGLGLPPVVIGMIRAGEAGSELAAAVMDAATYLEGAAERRTAIAQALAYPLLLALAGVGSLLLLVGMVIPRFAAIISDLGQDLPATTRMVVESATIVRAGFIPGLIVFLGLVGAWRLWLARPGAMERWHALLLGIPVLGTIRNSEATARSCAALAALSRAGVPLTTALVHAAEAAGDASLSSSLIRARTKILEGRSIASSLDDVAALTPTALRLLRAGEESGTIAEMAEHAAILERQRADQMTSTALRLIEPSMILFFALLVALISAALLQAIYTVRPG